MSLMDWIWTATDTVDDYGYLYFPTPLFPLLSIYIIYEVPLSVGYTTKNQWFSELDPELDDGGRNVNVYEKECVCV